MVHDEQCGEHTSKLESAEKDIVSIFEQIRDVRGSVEKIPARINKWWIALVLSVLPMTLGGLVGYGELKSSSASAQKIADEAHKKAEEVSMELGKIPALIANEFRNHEMADKSNHDALIRIEERLKKSHPEATP